MTWEEMIETGGNFFTSFFQRWFTLSDQGEWSIVRPILLGIFIFFWVVTLIRVAKDINERSKSFRFYFLALFVVLVGTPIFWGFLYLAIRPKRTLIDKLPRREALETSVVQCFNCGEYNLTSNRYCTACGEKIKIKCHECWKEFSASYGYCPICWAPNIE